MKAFLLAAGNGTRLRPLTDTTPKCLLPIQGVPLLSIWLELCSRYGIKEVLVNSHAHAENIRTFIEAQKKPRLRLRLFEEPSLLGSAGTIFANREWVSNESLFWILYADVLTDVNLQELLRFHRRRSAAATIGVYRVPEPKRCGIVTLNADGVVTDFVEKPHNPASNLAFSGILIATPEFLNYLPAQQPADIGFDVLPRLVGRMSGYEVAGYLQDIGTMRNYEDAQTSWPGL